MKLVVTGGGTGGHVYPALTVIDALRTAEELGMPRLRPDHLLWIGSLDGMEKGLVERQGINFLGLAAGGLRGMGILKSIRNAVRILVSILHAYRILSSFEPDAILATGGYACVAVTLAAWLQRIPVIIYLPDIEPGLAIRFLSWFAVKVAVTSEDSIQHLPEKKVVVTGYPVRTDIASTDRESALRKLSLRQEVKTLLVFGGSRGARSINQALMAGLSRLLETCQVIHVSGTLDADWVTEEAKKLPPGLSGRYQHHAFLHEMANALVSADLVVARAGAATIGEFPAAALPSLLVPLPHSGQHQRPNAEYLVRHGAARILADNQLKGKLVPTVLEMLDDEQALAAMKASARAIFQPNAARAIAEQLVMAGNLRAKHRGALA